MPLDIPDAATIARAIKSPYHLNKSGALRPAAFRPPPDRDDLSVMRYSDMGEDSCIKKGREIMAGRAGEKYAGIALLTAGKIREIGSAVHDSRDEYCGHAHIAHGVVLPRGAPTEGLDYVRVVDRCKQLAEAATFKPDEAE